jgi:hypothetical protein
MEPMRTKWWLGLAGSAMGFAAAARWLRTHHQTSALEREDARFHRAYDALRQDAATGTPTLVLFAGTCIFSDGAQRAEYPASAPASQLLKAAAHAPLGLYTLLLPLVQNQPDAELSASLKVRLADSRSMLERAELELSRNGEREGLSEAAREESVEVLRATGRFVEQTLTRQRVHAKSLAAFARLLGPQLLRLTEYATELELGALDAATEAALQNMTPEQRERFEVVIAGPHQARDRSLPLQYFQKRFGEAPGEERRVAYAESISGPAEARDLVGTRRLDRQIASAFFGNAKRLQRDVLGDAAQQLLERRPFPRIAPPSSETDRAASPARVS